MTQQEKLIARLKKGWLDSKQALIECDCLKLTTRVNEPDFVEKVRLMGLTIERKVKDNTRYVQYRITRG